MMGVRVSIVAIADLSVLQFKTQGWNVVPYTKIMIALVADGQKNFPQKLYIDEFGLPCVPHRISEEPMMTVITGGTSELTFKLKTTKLKSVISDLIIIHHHHFCITEQQTEWPR